jgi:hypothetical protein
MPNPGKRYWGENSATIKKTFAVKASSFATAGFFLR